MHRGSPSPMQRKPCANRLNIPLNNDAIQMWLLRPSGGIIVTVVFVHFLLLKTYKQREKDLMFFNLTIQAVLPILTSVHSRKNEGQKTRRRLAPNPPPHQGNART
ncbi:hypothetical protein HGRIS_011723 [Hohenbuehelia grisea]|uniref:Uncharacterized protein n=1 Tax=Hohenbuehelia grisea TaxID=104357 RepID=A0ABR3JW02_9AGAR